jgi:hypothetical protein
MEDSPLANETKKSKKSSGSKTTSSTPAPIVESKEPTINSESKGSKGNLRESKEKPLLRIQVTLSFILKLLQNTEGNYLPD